MKLPIIRQFEIAYANGWDKLYFAVDIHDTVLEADYIEGSFGGEFLGAAKEVLQNLSERKDICLIAFTSSYNNKKMVEWFKEQGIHFEYVNENPECGDTMYGDFSQKFFFNVLIDDKAGFRPDDWVDVAIQLEDVDSLTKSKWRNAPWL